ncbi:hypothetical protein KFK09_019713 [Dendrobium nobile]|uniref:Uncharacterized protein n=1 Tax=Dendrobium nobile TaxID=94219 RepID=A0A8T3ARW4_DENNO|nr:hypothetical protein KFK09_019713 [Dendrobium nobile]
MVEDKKAKVKKGWLVVIIGLDGDDNSNSGGRRRFAIPITYLHHPRFQQLLEAAHEAYGYASTGPLKLPCTVDDFLRLQWLVEHELQRRR